MFKYTGIMVGLIVMAAIMFGCMKSPNTPEQMPSLTLELEYHNAPFGQVINAGNTALDNIETALLKSNKIVDVPVVVLHFDDRSGEIAKDVSGFENHANLTNPEWFPVSASGGDGSSVVLSGLNSYGQIYDYYYQLSGIYGVTIDVTLQLFESLLAHQIIVDKIDYKGDGYRMGLQDRIPYFEISINNVVTRISASAELTPGQWYKLRAQFLPASPYLRITGQIDSTYSFETDRISLNASSSNLTIGAGTTGNFGLGSYFNGYIDELVITSAMDYEEFDLIRVGVLDANAMVNADSVKNLTSEQLSMYFYDSELWQKVTREFDRVFYNSDTTSVMSWGDLRSVWDLFYSTISEQNLAIKSGFAEGTVNGVPGLNILSVGAMRGEKMVYYGYGFVFAFKDRTTPAYIHMWQVE